MSPPPAPDLPVRLGTIDAARDSIPAFFSLGSASGAPPCMPYPGRAASPCGAGDSGAQLALGSSSSPSSSSPRRCFPLFLKSLGILRAAARRGEVADFSSALGQLLY